MKIIIALIAVAVLVTGVLLLRPEIRAATLTATQGDTEDCTTEGGCDAEEGEDAPPPRASIAEQLGRKE